MVKVRLQGTTIDLKRMRRAIERCRGVTVVSISDVLPNKGTQKYFRQYIDVAFDCEKETKHK